MPFLWGDTWGFGEKVNGGISEQASASPCPLSGCSVCLSVWERLEWRCGNRSFAFASDKLCLYIIKDGFSVSFSLGVEKMGGIYKKRCIFSSYQYFPPPAMYKLKQIMERENFIIPSSLIGWTFSRKKMLFLFSFFNCCSNIINHLPVPQPSPPSILDLTTPLWLCPWVLYACSLMTFSPSYPPTLPTPLWLLSVCS